MKIEYINVGNIKPYDKNAKMHTKEQIEQVAHSIKEFGMVQPIACEQLGRKCYTMELDPRYVDVIIKRWETYTGKTAVKL